MAEPDGVQNPVRVTLSEDFTTNKLSLGERYWTDDEDYNTPRKGILRKGEEYVVCADDRAVRHFLDGGDLVPVEGEEDSVPVTFRDRLTELPHISSGRAEQVEQDFATWQDFVDEVDVEYFVSADMKGVGASRAEQIVEAVREMEE